MHRFRQGWMRENCIHQFGFGGFKGTRNRKTLDKLGYFRTNHVSAEQLTCRDIKNGFDKPSIISKRNCLSITGKRELAHFDFIASLFCSGLGHANRCNLRTAISASWHSSISNCMSFTNPGNFFNAYYPFVAGFMS